MTKKYEANWNSLVRHPIASWFRDAKFGIYTHWGPYSVPAYGSNGTWYPHHMYIKDAIEYRHHVKTFGHPSKFGYKDFIPMFKAEKFDPEEWAELFKRAGARFAGPVAEHHDGFSMWNSKVNKWNSVQMGPKRDVVGELEKAIRKQGLKFIATFHHSYNWWFFPTWNREYDCSNPAYAELYSRPHAEDEKPDKEYLDVWREKLFEVIDEYQPDLIWFDFGLGRIQETYRKELLAYYYNKEKVWDKEVVVTYKATPKGLHNLPPGTGVIDLEVGKMNYMTPNLWITDTSIDAGPKSAWSYVKDVGYKSVERLVHNLIDRVSKNGYLLLNVGPRADGTIPMQAKNCLIGMGKWLEVNGEAIYGTTPWMRSGEGPTNPEGGGHFNENNEVRFTAHDIRFTVKGEAIYAICLGRPGDQITIKSLASLYDTEISTVRMLGVDKDLKWNLDEEGLTIEIPEEIPFEYACVFKISK